MKKRVRKKLRRGEFAEMGRAILIRRVSGDGADEFLDCLIDAVIAAGCSCSGCAAQDTFDLLVSCGTRQDDLDGRFQAIREWAGSRTDIASFSESALFDLASSRIPSLHSTKVEPKSAVGTEHHVG